MQFFF